jgi:hypothetical protein
MAEEEIQWTDAGGDAGGNKLEFSLVKEGGDIKGYILNSSGEDHVVENRPQISFTFQPDCLLKFDM